MSSSQEISGIGKRIRKYRTENKESANSLAKKLRAKFGHGSPSRQMITNLETGQKKDITVTELLEFSQVLGVSPVALICDIEQPEEPSDTVTTQAAKNKYICQWFNTDRFLPYIFDANGNATIADTPAANKLRSLMTDLRALKDARKRAYDSYILFKRVLQNKDIKDPDIADWLKQDSTNNTNLADQLTQDLKDHGMTFTE